jgi:hypothetical protein
MQTVQVARADSVGSVAAYGEAYLVGGAVAALGIVAALFVRSSGMVAGRERGAPEGAPSAEAELQPAAATTR